MRRLPNGPKRPNPIKVWRERRRFRKLSGPPRRARVRRPKGPGAMTRWNARRSVRKAAALPRGPRVNPVSRWRARRAVKGSQPAYSTRQPRPKVPLKDRMSSALYRPKPLKVDHMSIRERMVARASIRAGGPKAPAGAALFRRRSEKVIAGVVAGSVCFLVLTWLVSQAPPPEQGIQAFVVLPHAPEDATEIVELPPPVPIKSTTPTPKPTETTTDAPPPPPPPPTSTAPPPPPPPPPTTTTPKPTTTQPTTTPPTSPSPSTTGSCLPDQEPRCPTTTPPATTGSAPLAAGVAPGGPGGPLGATVLLLLVAAALARVRSHPA
jgi:hypothetical protein